MTNFDDVKSWVKTATASDIEDLISVIKARRTLLGIQAGLSFKTGDRVLFNTRNRGIIKGTFVKQNQKNAKVRADNGVTWTVSPNLIQADKGE